MVLPGGIRAVGRDPYGGFVSRDGLFVQFTFQIVRKADRDRLVDHVDFTVDGAPAPRDRGGSFSYLAPSRALKASRRVLGAHIVLKDGRSADTSFPVTVSDCAGARSFADLFGRRGHRLVYSFSAESGSAPLARVSVAAVAGLTATAPKRLAGKVVGTLQLDAIAPETHSPAPLVLRLPKHPAGRSVVLLEDGATRVTLHPGARHLLTIGRLPAGHHSFNLTFSAYEVLGARPSAPRIASRVTLTPPAGRSATLAMSLKG